MIKSLAHRELALDSYNQVIDNALINQLDTPVPSMRALKAIVPYLESLRMVLEPTTDSLYHPVWRRANAPLDLEIIVLEHLQSLGFEFNVGWTRAPEFNATCHGNYPKFGGLMTVNVRRWRSHAVTVKIDFNWADQ